MRSGEQSSLRDKAVVVDTRCRRPIQLSANEVHYAASRRGPIYKPSQWRDWQEITSFFSNGAYQFGTVGLQREDAGCRVSCGFCLSVRVVGSWGRG